MNSREQDNDARELGLFIFLRCVVVLWLGVFSQQHRNNLERLTRGYNCARKKLIGAVNHLWSEGLSVDNKW